MRLAMPPFRFCVAQYRRVVNCSRLQVRQTSANPRVVMTSTAYHDEAVKGAFSRTPASDAVQSRSTFETSNRIGFVSATNERHGRRDAHLRHTRTCARAINGRMNSDLGAPVNHRVKPYNDRKTLLRTALATRRVQWSKSIEINGA